MMCFTCLVNFLVFKGVGTSSSSAFTTSVSGSASTSVSGVVLTAWARRLNFPLLATKAGLGDTALNGMPPAWRHHGLTTKADEEFERDLSPSTFGTAKALLLLNDELAIYIIKDKSQNSHTTNPFATSSRLHFPNNSSS
jgi:hypothetical protein